jgi:hypothetical protein
MRTCVGPGFVMQNWTLRTSVMPVLVAHSWSGRPLRGADLRRAYLRLAKLDGAGLSDANLEGVEGLTQAQLNRAHCDSGTKLPVGLTRVEDGKR